MALNKNQINEYKDKLLEEKVNIKEQLEEIKEDLDFGDDVDSFDEETDESEAFSNYIGIKRSLDNQLEDIESALDKIEKGGYGVCKKCGKEISEDVLDASPASTLCKECKKEE